MTLNSPDEKQCNKGLSHEMDWIHFINDMEEASIAM